MQIFCFRLVEISFPMPRNIEIKSRIDGTLEELIERIRPLADAPPVQYSQLDTFYPCPSGGRLKLRIQQVFLSSTKSFRLFFLSFAFRILRLN